MVNEDVVNIMTTSDKWLGSLAFEDVGIWVDTGLLLIFGGVPWQVNSMLGYSIYSSA